MQGPPLAFDPKELRTWLLRSSDTSQYTIAKDRPKRCQKSRTRKAAHCTNLLVRLIGHDSFEDWEVPGEPAYKHRFRDAIDWL